MSINFCFSNFVHQQTLYRNWVWIWCHHNFILDFWRRKPPGMIKTVHGFFKSDCLSVPLLAYQSIWLCNGCDRNVPREATGVVSAHRYCICSQIWASRIELHGNSKQGKGQPKTHWWNDTIRLSLPEWNLSIGLYDNVACLSSSLGADNSFDWLDLGLEWLLWAECIQRQLKLLQLYGDLGLLVHSDGHLLRCLCCPHHMWTSLALAQGCTERNLPSQQ